uniref:Uncharacterized protein n=1 Tax=Fusarium oxysporum (strain Fo5176) TaxID=660025 RepID=A0A0D2Y1M0_FUSOF
MSVKLDITDSGAVEEAVAMVVSWKGRLDFAVNAAGILPAGVNVDGIDPFIWRRVIDVNLTGTFNCMQHEILGCAAYVASKHAVNGLTKTAALEYARKGICVNAVAPGNIDTPMLSRLGMSAEALGHATQPSGKLGKAGDVADLIVFLLSERAGFINGSIVAIDGGTTSAGYSNGDASQVFKAVQ